jgi:methylenetetrahydrofolate reductase (NADPH)
MDPAVAAALPTDFNYAVDLVRLIREEFGDYFGISVAGYPYLHSDCPSYEAGLQHLKEKVDAGADFVISQLFFQAEDFLKWVDDCRAIGITCPIIPGILPIQGYASLRNMTKMCSVPVPDVIKNAVEPIKDDDAAIKEFGIQYAADMCRKLIKGGVPGLHFYTLNREVSTERILIELGMIEENALSRALPWKKPLHPKRSREDVRPIFWANRQKSYLSRTAEWDDFPNGRWGDSRSPAFGELTDYHLFLHSREMKPEILRKMWGEELNGVSDVSRTFIRYLNGEIDQLPWSDNPPGKETSIIKTKLLKMNESGLWTINSQPRVNGVPSSDRSVGWGGPNGVVYQKAYIEFFTSPKVLEILLGVFKRVEPRINYQAVNMKGDTYSNLDGAVAVTWGVFPGAEIMQPTVVDPVSFHVWKEEAFTLWLARWAGIYPKESVSHQTLQSIHDNYFLVTIVDNDFINGDIFDVFDDVIDHISRLGEQRPLERAPSDSLLA